MKKLGAFQNHSNYNGVFLGLPQSDWHLEITESSEEAVHVADDDDLLVFYAENEQEFDEINQELKK